MGEMRTAGDVELWVERRGQGPDVLLIAGLGDPAEAWEPQLEGLADRWGLTAFDNRGVGRSPLPPAGEPFTVATMADDAAALLRALEVPAAHVMGFSGGSAIAQELALPTVSTPSGARCRPRTPARTPGAGDDWSLLCPVDPVGADRRYLPLRSLWCRSWRAMTTRRT
jgi:alpha/beta hydrolase fold